MTDLSLTPRSSGAPTVLGEGRRRSSRLLRALALVLIASGALAVIDAAVTLLWQEPVSALIASLRQDHLQKVLHQEERALPTPVERRALASIGDERRRIGYLAGELERHAGDGSPVGRIVIPRIGASFVLIKGTNTEDLKGGPGVDTNLPGVGETTLIAGHRTTYLAPFRHIDALAPGNHILLKMPYAHAGRAVGLHPRLHRRKTPARVRAPDPHRPGRSRAAAARRGCGAADRRPHANGRGGGGATSGVRIPRPAAARHPVARSSRAPRRCGPRRSS
jgi:sortase A